MSARPSALAALLLAAVFAVRAAEIPAEPRRFLEQYCLDCHDADTRKGEVSLDFTAIEWDSRDVQNHWERALKVIAAGEMPPKMKSQPAPDERSRMLAWLDESLMRHSQTGGTVARRLNRDEYLNTIHSLFELSFELPPGFPGDTEGHGFDNVGETLVMSPPLMSAYAESAALIADEIFPPIRPQPKSHHRHIPPEEMAISYSSGSIRDGALRLAIKDPPLQRSCTWPSKVELAASGSYRVRVSLSQFAPQGDEPMAVQILARDVSDNDAVDVTTLRLLHSVEVARDAPEVFEFEAELYAGQTIVIYWANAPLSGDKPELEGYLKRRFAADQRLLAAWQQVEHGNSLRGGLGWDRVKALMADPALDLTAATPDSPETAALLRTMLKNPVLYYETIAFDHYENGPALEIHAADIEGPLHIVDGPKDKTRQRIRARLLGDRGQLGEDEWTRQILERLLTRAWRRPVAAESVAAFARLVADHRTAGHSFDQGMHLAIRTALISPRFLYRALQPGPLDNYDLASRLSYFLHGRPPDEKLLRLASTGKLTDPDVLRREAARRLPTKAGDFMIQNFTGQWLDTRLIAEIMPDPRLKFSTADQQSARQEVEMFFAEMLNENRPLTDFIDPDFTFASASLAKKIYGVKNGYNAKSKAMQRIALPRGGRHGGLLGQAAVLLATANGVDTQPVLRGVWVLENIIGDPPPPPPAAVPAITPDTTGANTPRDLLTAHTADPGCATCHRKIDPVGFALENFDAVGRWRDEYSIQKTDERGRPVTLPGPPIDARGQLPDGTPIRDVVDLKRWLVTHIDHFSECLAEKLLTYATGRPPGYAERQEIARIVRANHTAGNGFRDLMLALINSETFRTK